MLVIRATVNVQPSTHSSPLSSYTSIPPLIHILLHPALTFLNVALQIHQALVEQTLLIIRNLANRVDLLHAVRAKSNVRRKVGATLVLVKRRVDEGGLNDALLALRRFEQGLREASTSHSHRKRSRALAILRLYDLITAKLHTVHVFIELLALEFVPRLAKQRHDCLAGMTANDGDVLVRGIGVLELGDEAGGADDVEGGDAEELLGVVDAFALEDFGGDGNGAVDGVRDDEHVRVGAMVGGGFSEVTDDGGVGVEEVYISVLNLLQIDPLMNVYAHHHGSCLACVVRQLG